MQLIIANYIHFDMIDLCCTRINHEKRRTQHFLGTVNTVWTKKGKKGSTELRKKESLCSII